MSAIGGNCLCGGMRWSFPLPSMASARAIATAAALGQRAMAGATLPGAVVSGDTLTIYRSSNFAERGF